MLEVNANQILDGIQSFVDQAGRSFSDGDQVAAINALKDAKNAITTLTGVLGLPPQCKTGIPGKEQTHET